MQTFNNSETIKYIRSHLIPRWQAIFNRQLKKKKLDAALLYRHLRNSWSWIINFGSSTFPGNDIPFRFVVYASSIFNAPPARPQPNWSKRLGSIKYSRARPLVLSLRGKETIKAGNRYLSAAYFVYVPTPSLPLFGESGKFRGGTGINIMTARSLDWLL